MVINSEKKKFMVVNGNETDKMPITVQGCTVLHCLAYTYLGSVFTVDGKFSSMFTKHVSDKHCNLLKFYAFVRRNASLPFCFKRVFEACTMSSLLYGCEGWFSTSVGKLNTIYMSAVKALLGVRTSTPNEQCLIEIGQPSLKAMIMNRQYRYFSKIMNERKNMCDDPLDYSLELCKNSNTKGWQYIQNVLTVGKDCIMRDRVDRKKRIQTSEASKCVTYVALNPTLAVHDAYMKHRGGCQEYQRISFTRLRLSSHKLRIETGRWQRLQRQDRVCDCSLGSVQDELHVLTQCGHCSAIRLLYPELDYNNVQSILESDIACSYVHKCLASIP